MSNEMLSQEEIDLLLKGTNEKDDKDDNYELNDIITDVEKDTLGEIGNISMGTAATTVSTLLNKKVLITTPQVNLTNTGELSHDYQIPFVAVDVRYTEGLEGSNILMIKTDDVKIIADTMMGKDEIDIDRELTELDLSVISEVMNQMMGSASTSLSEIFKKRINIDPPQSSEITFNEGMETLDVLMTDGPIIKVSFKMVVEDLMDSELMQLMPLEFAKNIVEELHGGSQEVIEKELEMEKTDDYVEADNININAIIEEKGQNDKTKHNLKSREEKNLEKEHIIIKKPEFETFDTSVEANYDESIDLVGDIPVELTVELGRTIKKIGEILAYGPGTIIELDNLLGEPLNVYANGKYIAKGEVVVIDDNFGIRITDIDKS